MSINSASSETPTQPIQMYPNQHPDARYVDLPDQPLGAHENTVFQQVTAPVAAEFERNGGITELQSWLQPQATQQEVQRAEREPRFRTLRSLGQSAIGAVSSIRGKLGGLFNRDAEQSQAPTETAVDQATILPVTVTTAEPTTKSVVMGNTDLQFEPPHSIAFASSEPLNSEESVPRKPGDIYSRPVGNLAFQAATLAPMSEAVKPADKSGVQNEATPTTSGTWVDDLKVLDSQRVATQQASAVEQIPQPRIVSVDNHYGIDLAPSDEYQSVA